jgi:hypothetical protein
MALQRLEEQFQPRPKPNSAMFRSGGCCSRAAEPPRRCVNSRCICKAPALSARRRYSARLARMPRSGARERSRGPGRLRSPAILVRCTRARHGNDSHAWGQYPRGHPRARTRNGRPRRRTSSSRRAPGLCSTARLRAPAGRAACRHRRGRADQRQRSGLGPRPYAPGQRCVKWHAAQRQQGALGRCGRPPNCDETT